MANFGNDSVPPSLAQDGAQRGPQRYQFSQEEVRVLKQCNRESFYNRCLPLGTVFSAAVYYAVKAGYLKANPRWGAAPKMGGAIFLGYILGKASYQKVCVERLMELDTPLAAQLRKQRGKVGFQEAMSIDPAFQSVGILEEPAVLKDIGRQSSQSDVMDTRPISNFDIEHTSIFSGNDFSKPIDSTADMLNDDNLPPRAPPSYSTSYDDLRRKNRMEYEAQRYPTPPPSTPAVQQQQPQQPPQDNIYRPPPQRETPPVRRFKNQYGDVWDDVPQK